MSPFVTPSSSLPERFEWVAVSSSPNNLRAEGSSVDSLFIRLPALVEKGHAISVFVKRYFPGVGNNCWIFMLALNEDKIAYCHTSLRNSILDPLRKALDKTSNSN